MHIIIRLFVKLTIIIVSFVEVEFVQELGGASMVQHGTYTEAPAVIDSTTIRSQLLAISISIRFKCA